MYKKITGFCFFFLIINPLFSQWVLKATAPTPTWGPGACSLNGYIYMIGGNNGSDLATNQRYDPATNTWTTLTPMPTARSYPAVVGASNGKIYVFGGTAGGAWLNTVQEYDPAANTWTNKTPMPTGRMGLGAAEYNGKIYVIGGWNGVLLATNEEYNISTNTWASRAPMPTARYQVSCAMTGGLVYAVGGFVATQVNTNQAYNPVTNTWTTKTGMNTPRYLHGVTTLGGMVWAVGGWPNTGTSEFYNPGTNTWTNGATLLQSRYRIAAAATNTCIYALGGFTGVLTVGTNEENCSVPLPIELTAFTASYSANTRENIVTWVTASEINNSHFRCERSENAIDWEVISVIPGAGYSSTEISYTYNDPSPAAETYYRLVQVDFDGHEEYYGPVYIQSADLEMVDYLVYPNPTSGKLFIEFNIFQKGEIELIDLTGKSVFHTSIHSQKQEIDINHLSNGVYTLIIEIDQQFFHSKVSLSH